MGREIHRMKVNGKVRYAALSTVTMSYATPFGTRKELTTALKKEGYDPKVVAKMFKQVTTVKVNKKEQTVSFPVYRVIMKDMDKFRVK